MNIHHSIIYRVKLAGSSRGC